MDHFYKQLSAAEQGRVTAKVSEYLVKYPTINGDQRVNVYHQLKEKLSQEILERRSQPTIHFHGTTITENHGVIGGDKNEGSIVVDGASGNVLMPGSKISGGTVSGENNKRVAITNNASRPSKKVKVAAAAVAATPTKKQHHSTPKRVTITNNASCPSKKVAATAVAATPTKKQHHSTPKRVKLLSPCDFGQRLEAARTLPEAKCIGFEMMDDIHATNSRSQLAEMSAQTNRRKAQIAMANAKASLPHPSKAQQDAVMYRSLYQTNLRNLEISNEKYKGAKSNSTALQKALDDALRENEGAKSNNTALQKALIKVTKQRDDAIQQRDDALRENDELRNQLAQAQHGADTFDEDDDDNDRMGASYLG